MWVLLATNKKMCQGILLPIGGITFFRHLKQKVICGRILQQNVLEVRFVLHQIIIRKNLSKKKQFTFATLGSILDLGSLAKLKI